MPYTRQAERANPSCILFLLDQSGSMVEPFGGAVGNETKSHGVADAVNKALSTLVIRCTNKDGVRDYYDVGVLGYGRDTHPTVRPAFGGTLAGRELVRISEVADHPLAVETRTRRISDGAGGNLEEEVKFRVWLNPVAENGTPMCETLKRAQSLIQGWIQGHPDAFPPIVLHLTDGQSTDGDPTEHAESIRHLSTSDGGVLLFNCHISSHRASELLFPADEALLPNEYARQLFRMSSELPQVMIDTAKKAGFQIQTGARGFAFNAGLADVVSFLDIGTRTAIANH